MYLIFFYFVLGAIIFSLFKFFYIERGFAPTLFIFASLIIIFAPIFYLNKDEIEKEENRTLAILPYIYQDTEEILSESTSEKSSEAFDESDELDEAIKKEFNENFMSDFEVWLNDRFGFRKMYIGFYETLIRTFQPTRVENDKYFSGQDDWLFFKGNNSIENFQGINLYEDYELQTIKNTLVERNEWFKANGIEYYIYIAPDKHNIYGEYYPEYINKISDDSKVKQLLELLKDTDIKVIYSYDKLISEKESNLLYYKGDTHWNELGAFFGYEDLMEAIKKDFEELDVLSLSDFNLYYDTEKQSNTEEMLSYNIEDIEYPRLDFAYDTSYEFIVNSRFGSEGIITENENSDLDVIVLRDSFANDLERYISETFGRVHFLWYETFYDQKDYILEYQPDIVVDEVVERLLDRVTLGEVEKE